MKNQDICFSDTGDHPSPGSHRVTDDAIPALPEPPKKRGRPKGYPKSGGRVTGTKNWTSDEIRNALLSKSNAIDVLADIVAGKPLLVGTERTSSQTGAGSPVWRHPSLNQRLKATELVLAKVLPDLKAVEAVVDANVRNEDAPQYTTRHTARAILSILGRANLPIDTPTPPDSDLVTDIEASVSPREKSEEEV